MNRDSLKIHATNSNANCAANNGSNTVSTPSVTAVGTINSGKGIRRWFSSLLLLGIVFGFGLCMLSSNKAYAYFSLDYLIANMDKTVSISAKCEHPGTKPQCGKCWYGNTVIQPLGSGGMKCETTTTDLDLFAALGITSPNTTDEQTTCVFFPKDSEKPTKEGRGYIGANVIYGHYVEDLNEFINIYTLCNAKEIKGYDEWIKESIRYYEQNERPVINSELLKTIITEANTPKLTVTSNGDHAILEFDNKEGAAMQFDVVDVNGNTVKTITAQSGSFTVSGLVSGVYFVKSVTNPNLQAKIVIAQ